MMVLLLVLVFFPKFLFAALYSSAQSMEEAQKSIREYVERRIFGYENPETVCNQTGLYMDKMGSQIYPFDDCLRYASSVITEAKKEEEAKNQEKIKAEQQEEAELAAKKTEEEQKEKNLISDLKSGKKRPASLKEAMLLYDAPFGLDLASAPKIKPDGKLYGVMGTIAVANEDDSFIAESIEGLAKLIDFGAASEKKYFEIKIPNELKEKYENSAQIGHIFNMVGRYIANAEYNTVSGQVKSMPVFEAVYFSTLGNTEEENQSVQNDTNQSDQPAISDQPSPESEPLNIDPAEKDSNTSQPNSDSQIQQEKDELARYKAKDAIDAANDRINAVWNATTKEIRKSLLPEQRQWLKQRENDCSVKATTEAPDNAIAQDTIRFKCMVEMTDQRTEVLKVKIASMAQLQ